MCLSSFALSIFDSKFYVCLHGCVQSIIFLFRISQFLIRPISHLSFFSIHPGYVFICCWFFIQPTHSMTLINMITSRTFNVYNYFNFFPINFSVCFVKWLLFLCSECVFLAYVLQFSLFSAGSLGLSCHRMVIVVFSSLPTCCPQFQIRSVFIQFSFISIRLHVILHIVFSSNHRLPGNPFRSSSTR